jgi:hypothetical protein
MALAAAFSEKYFFLNLSHWKMFNETVSSIV